AKQVDQSLPNRKLTGLLIDESGWVKKGTKSVGVDHQYCGLQPLQAGCPRQTGRDMAARGRLSHILPVPKPEARAVASGFLSRL
ncbi:MAG: transposase, partial [Spirochaetales bacterium]|nr:transposase [Spirochaetales bacterium]